MMNRRALIKYTNRYKYYKWVDWVQPVLTSNTSFGTVTVNSVNDPSTPAFCALDGITSGGVFDGHYWAAISKPGWFKWVLPYKIKISQIKFYNMPQGTNLSKNVQFFANDAKTIPLGNAFVAIQSGWSINDVVVPDIETDTVYCYISTSYNKYVGIGELNITAKYAVESNRNDYDYKELIV